MLIYNPVNRRIPLTLAERLQRDLRRRLPEVPVTLGATQYSGHARQSASSRTGSAGRPLIVPVSGDGVYNEVVNGMMDVAGSGALTAVAAGGNANDHRRSTRRMSLVDAVVAAHLGGHARHLDLLRWRIAAMALRATTVGLGPQPRVHRVEFATVDAVPVQIDGEIFHLEPASEIVIESVPQALATVG